MISIMAQLVSPTGEKLRFVLPDNELYIKDNFSEGCIRLHNSSFCFVILPVDHSRSKLVSRMTKKCFVSTVQSESRCIIEDADGSRLTHAIRNHALRNGIGFSLKKHQASLFVFTKLTREWKAVSSAPHSKRLVPTFKSGHPDFEEQLVARFLSGRQAAAHAHWPIVALTSKPSIREFVAIHPNGRQMPIRSRVTRGCPIQMDRRIDRSGQRTRLQGKLWRGASDIGARAFEIPAALQAQILHMDPDARVSDVYGDFFVTLMFEGEATNVDSVSARMMLGR